MGTTNNREAQRKGLSTRESQALSRLAGENRQVISINDIADPLDIPRKSAKDMAYSLKEKGWLERIAHGNTSSCRSLPVRIPCTLNTSS